VLQLHIAAADSRHEALVQRHLQMCHRYRVFESMSSYALCAYTFLPRHLQ
jgi:hypothetical protein